MMKNQSMPGMPSGENHMGGQMGGQMGGHGNMMAMLKQLPAGAKSPSGHYWCAMCKKMFEMEDPVCPYMPTMCVNTPIPIELMAPGSTGFYERVGLFYPKLVQRLLAAAVSRSAEPEKLGLAFAENYLTDLAEWNVQYKSSPIEAIKSFLIYTSGFDTATRTTDAGITFYLMDAQILWGEEMPDKKRSKAALLTGALRVAEAVGLTSPIDLHFMTVTSGKMGRYFCAQCSMFFEYGQPQAQVTCPFMSQKCKFRPKPVGGMAEGQEGMEAAAPISLDVDLLTKIFAVSPKLLRSDLQSALASAPDAARGQAPFDAAAARELLTAELQTWGFNVADAGKMAGLFRQLSID
ncbi:MAG TPA: hypothetical protein VGK74_21225 [Symbiobacteriaceae bacterium]|jgi:hypothetical protein